MDLHLIWSVLHDLPYYLSMVIGMAGDWSYAILFAIIFAETGLIVTPFLPGDSLLFTIGALTALQSMGAPQGTMMLDLAIVIPLLIVAANCGDVVNYAVGRWLGLKLFRNPRSKIFNPNYLERTQGFYSRHGGKTVMIARFLPILRTYAPFVAGIGRMKFARFALFSVSGGALWITSITLLGHFFGNLQFVKDRFQYVVLAIIVISLIPAVIEFLRMRRIPVAQELQK